MGTKTDEITMARYQNRYNNQLKKERTLKIVKGIMTATAITVALVALVCLFLMFKVEQ